MQSILVPTDFSPNAYNAARYAMALAKDLGVTKIVLYNAYLPYVPNDPELGMPLQDDLDELKQLSEDGLLKMKNTFTTIDNDINLLYESDYNMITNGVLDACKKHKADLVVMGITGADTKLGEAIIGSNAVDVSKHSETPVIIVPAGARYSKLNKILLAADFKKIAETMPVAEIKKILDATNAQLDILHVEANTNDTEANLENEKTIFNSLLDGYYPQYHFLKGESFTDAINKFTVENNSDLIIIIPKKHGLFEGIFRKSHTKALAFHSHIPVMTIHE